MNNLIRIHESILEDYLICSGHKKYRAKSKDDRFDELHNYSDIYIKKEDFYKLILTQFFMSISTLFNVNRFMDFHLYLDDFINYLDLFKLEILEELDEYPCDEELSIFPSNLLGYYKNISNSIFRFKQNEINEFYLSYLKAMNINFAIDLSSKTKFESSIIKIFKSINECHVRNKGAYLLGLEQVAFNYIYNTITLKTNVDYVQKLALLGKLYYYSFSFDFPFLPTHSYSENLERHLCVLEATLNNHSNLKENNTIMIINSLFRANNFFDIDETITLEMYPGKHFRLSEEERYIQVQINRMLLELISKVGDYDQENCFSGIKKGFIKIDDYFLLLILGNEIDRGSKIEYVYNQYKMIFEKFHNRLNVLKNYTLHDIERWYEVLKEREKDSLTNDIRNEIEEICLKQKYIIKSVNFDQKDKYLEVLDLEVLKTSILRKHISYEIDENGFELPTSYLTALEFYMNTYYLDYFNFEIDEKMVNRYDMIVDLENKELINKYILELEAANIKSGNKDESTFIEKSINNITSKNYSYFGNDIPISLQREYIDKLSEKSEFLRLFASSEFMFKILIEDANSYENMELTPIITGLLKGTEQMLKRFIEWYHQKNSSFNSDIITGYQNVAYLISEDLWKERLTISNLSNHIIIKILPVVLKDSKLQHLAHKISRSINIWNKEIRNSKFHHTNIYAYDTNLEYIFDESYNIVRIIIQLMNLCCRIDNN